MRTAGILSIVALSLAGFHGRVHADTARAWAAAKAALPADAKLVIGLDIASVQKTQLFQTFYPKLHEDPEATAVLDMMKDACKLDPVAVVRGAVIATSSDQKEVAVYLALSGVDRSKLSSCFLRVAQTRHKDAKVSIKQSGDITELTKDSDTAFIGWIGKDVIVVSNHAQDRSSLTRWMGGKGAFARSDLAKTLGKVNTGASIWGAAEVAKEIQPGMNLKGGYGAVTSSKGNLVIDFHAVMDSAEQASSAATMANQQLDVVKQGVAPIPPEAVALLKTVTVSPDKDEVRIKASVDEKDLVSILAHGLNGLGGP